MNNIAHVKQNCNGEWDIQTIENHAEGVACLAKKLADEFGSGDWASIAGLVHDLGKYRPAFQKHIKVGSGFDSNAHIDSEARPATRHASTGAVYLYKNFEQPFGKLLAYIVAGHHAGLPDADATNSGLKEQLVNDDELLREIDPKNIPKLENIPDCLPVNMEHTEENLHLWVRMIFSCLVDADWLDTELFMDNQKSETRTTGTTIQQKHLDCFNQYMKQFTEEAKSDNVYKTRQIILEQAKEGGRQESGIYTMTVPTGGGKTLSSLAFSLNHCIEQNKRRVIYAIPFTSIIEQTAHNYRDVFKQLDEEVVLEHHCNIDSAIQTKQSQLATENWDMPLVVTTTVQLFESLFASKPSSCRKLHNIVNSVVVIDEIQSLPPQQLNPIIHAINELSKNYGVTFLMMTATPTGWQARHNPLGKKELNELEIKDELIVNPQQHYDSLKRVEYHRLNIAITDNDSKELIQHIAQHSSALIIVNTIKQAKQLFQAISNGNEHDEGLFHLSTHMCPLHRRHTISQIKERLRENQPTKVVSTQLVEAGVDLDFPVVYRAIAGLDSIIQAAGRCNREGELDKGDVYIFDAPTPEGAITFGRQAMSSIYAQHNAKDVFNNVDIVLNYFCQYFAEFSSHDQSSTLTKLTTDKGCNIQFRTVAKDFKMIEETDKQVIFVDYATTDQERLQIKNFLSMLDNSNEIEKWLLRKLQPYGVSLYQWQITELEKENQIRKSDCGYWVIAGGGVYDDKLGFLIEDKKNDELV